MTENAHLPGLLIALGLLFLAGLAADSIGRKTPLPRVTLLLACGLLIGQPGLDLIPPEAEALYDFLAITALTMVAFLLGSSLTLAKLKQHGRAIFLISLGIVLVTLAVVGGGLWLIAVPAPAALMLGAIATATAPAATQDALHQSGRSGPFVDRLRGIVAIDDVWGLLVFSLAIAMAHGLNGTAHIGHLIGAGREIFGAILLGLAVGLPAAYLTGRLSKGDPLMSEALGIVFLTAGLAIWLELSFLIAGMTAGAIVANLARHHDRAFHEIEHVHWPFMLLFFILAGASLDIAQLAAAGGVGAAYVILRIVSRIAGGWIGATLAGAERAHRPWYGVALLPQAGVAVGMALVAAREFPEHAGLILTITVGTTVVFELIGPAATIMAVRRVHKT